MGPVSQALDLLALLPEPALLAILWGGALLENLLPPVPADTFVVVGGLLVDRGVAAPVPVFLGIWLANAGGALLVYAFGYRRGRRFFELGAGRHVLSPGQLERIAGFYRRWGVATIFVARFVPGFRAVVPAFAGVSHLSPWAVAPPLVVASGLWYGTLLWLGIRFAGQIPRIEAWLAGVNRGLLWTAVVVAVGVLVWWLRTRGEEPEDG